MSQRRFLTAIVLSLAVIGLYAFNRHGTPVIHNAAGPTMGTTWSVRYVLDQSTGEATPAKVHSAIDLTLAAVNQAMSTYIADSELMALNRAPLHLPIKVSQPLFTVVEQAVQVSQLSGGAYDVTVGTLVNLWGFGSLDGSASAQTARLSDIADTIQPQAQAAFMAWVAEGGAAHIPDRQSVERAKQNTGFQSLVLARENRTITKTRPVFIDLSSIAKGYGVDQVALALEQLGISRYMVEVGGEIRLKGRKPNGQGWKIAVREPALDKEVNTVVSLDGRAIATSGDYLNYYEVDGKHFSHLIDARTGYPEQHRLASVAVIADQTSLADAYATMFMILGEQEGVKLAQKNGIDAYFIYHTDAGFQTISTARFDSYRVDR